uniref:Ecdysone-induced protein 74EF n=1 Tax=Caenorhabditis tropicalis TaxID=1561998 RepID=A0A1I7V1M1_9PELO
MSTTTPHAAPAFSSGTTGGGAQALQHCSYHLGASVGSSSSGLNNNSIHVPNNNNSQMGMSPAGTSNGSNLTNGQQRKLQKSR